MNRFFIRKSVSVIVMIAFLSMICFAYPGHSEQVVKTEKQEKVKTVEAEAEATVEVDEYYSRDDANVIEDEGYPGAKKKKFPWLLVVGGLVVVGVVLYFLVFKTKKYELTVNVDAGVTGSPAAGTSKHKKGTTINYNYSLAAGYEQLSVKVDGTAKSASGSITMDAAHTITVTAVKSVTGTYKGTTSQGYNIELRVTKVGGISTLTYLWIKMKGFYGASSWLLLTLWGNPNTQILNHSFSYSSSSMELTGNFTVNGTTTVSGTWNMHYNYYGYNFTSSGTYNASQTAKSTRGYAKLRPGEEKISAELYENGKLIKRIKK
ncbi:MAG: hypothetical protein KAT34_02705 [Candidatus Aminicenantes bacterium]|nr:hypothetical protein [Candidatus Aminicenantes bacterium]